jgi:hypothetical protein
MAEEQVTATQADGAPAPHPTDNIPVDVGHTEPLIVAKEQSVADPAPTPAPTAGADPTPAADGSDPDGKRGVPKLPEWAQKKLADASFAEREARREAKRLADEVAALKAAAAPKPDAATPTAADADNARAAAPDPNAQFGGYRSQADFNAAVTAEASRREAVASAARAENEFNDRCNTAYSKGKAAFADEFDAAVANLNSVGVMNRDVLDLVLETEDPAKVLFELGSDPDKAASIVAMAPARRAIEIAKLSVATPPKKAPTPLSNAPRPIGTVEGSARVSAGPSDADDDETFFRKREAELRAANA